MIDRKNLEKLLRKSFEAGRDQGMMDIESIITQKPSLQTPDQAYEAFLQNEAALLKKLTQT